MPAERIDMGGYTLIENAPLATRNTLRVDARARLLAEAGGSAPPGSDRAPATGIRTTVPQGQPSSGYGHWPRRPQAAQGTVTHSSAHARWTTAVGVPWWSSGGVTGAPQAHGYDGAAY